MAHALARCRRAALVFQVLAIGCDRIGHGADTAAALLAQTFAGTLLRLLERDEQVVIGIGEVGGNTDRVGPVVAAAGIDAGQPFASSALGLAVSKVEQTGFEVAVIGLTTRLEISASGATSEGGVADS